MKTLLPLLGLALLSVAALPAQVLGGYILYESDAIAFDTSLGLWRNPKLGTTYGANAPAGAWNLSDSQKHAVNVTGSSVPVFRANGGGTQSDPKPGDQWINPDGS